MTNEQDVDVLYLAMEDTERRLKERLEVLLSGRPAPPGLHFATEWRRLDRGGLEDLRKWLEDHPKARCVIVDTLVKVRKPARANRNIYDEDYEAVTGLKQMADQYGVTILLVHHLRKTPDKTDPFNEISGSTGLTGAPDTIMVLKRGRGQADGILHITGRDVDEEQLAMSFQDGRRTLVGDAAEFAMSEARREIVKLLQYDGPMGPTAISQTLGKNLGTIKSLTFKMVQDGQIRNEGGRYTVQRPSTP